MSLQVRQILEGEYSRFASVADRWEILSSRALKTLDPSSDIYGRMSDSSTVCLSLFCKLQGPRKDSSIKFFISEDTNGTPQALAMTCFRSEEICVKFLASCPWNIAPIANVGNYPVKGAGTSLLLEIIRQASYERKGVFLESYALAKPFYEKFGFTAVSLASPNAVPMSLSIEKICSLYPQYSPSIAA